MQSLRIHATDVHDARTADEVAIEKAAQAVTELLGGAEVIEFNHGDPRDSRLWQTGWVESNRGKSLWSFAPHKLASDMGVHAATVIRALDRLASELGVMQWHTRDVGPGARCSLMVLSPFDVFANKPKVRRAPPQREFFFDADATGNACAGAAPAQALCPSAPYIRARANEWNERNEEKDPTAEGKGAAPPPTSRASSSHSIHSPVARFDVAAREELGVRVVDEAGEILRKLGEPMGLLPWIALVAAYLQVASGHVSQAEVENIIFAANNPGDAARTSNVGRLFTGGLKALCFRHRDELAGLTLFVGTDLCEARSSTVVQMPRIPRLRECMAELCVPALDPRWFQPYGKMPPKAKGGP